MSFRDDKQRAMACAFLLEGAHMRGFWTIDGPTDKAVEHLKTSMMSDAEYLMLQVAWDVWNGSGRAMVALIVDTLDENNLDAVGTLLTAIAAGPSGVEHWLRCRT